MGPPGTPPVLTRLGAALAVAGALLTACSPAGTRGISATSTSSPVTSASPSSTAAVVGPAPSAGPVAVDGTGWSANGLQGPIPGPGSCHATRAADGLALPDPACTPGAVDDQVTQANLGQTICRPGGWTSSVRPPESMTEPYKVTALAAYGDSGPLSAYELDHLVPLELGGASDTRNLWPEPDDRPPGAANSKDPVENELHDLVCAALRGGPAVPLAVAQRLIAADWTTALARARAADVQG